MIFIKNKRTKGHDGHLSSNELRGGGCYRVKGILDYLYLISRSKKFLTFGNKSQSFINFTVPSIMHTKKPKIFAVHNTQDIKVDVLKQKI